MMISIGTFALLGSLWCQAETVMSTKVGNAEWLPNSTPRDGAGAVESGGTIFIVLKDGAAALQDGVFIPIALPEPDATDFILTKDELWLSTRHNGIFKIDLKTKRFIDRFKLRDGLVYAEGNNMDAIPADARKSVWFTSCFHLDVYRPAEAKWIDVAEHLASQKLPRPGCFSNFLSDGDSVWLYFNDPGLWGGALLQCAADGSSCRRHSEQEVWRSTGITIARGFAASEEKLWIWRSNERIAEYDKPTGKWALFSGEAAEGPFNRMIDAWPRLRHAKTFALRERFEHHSDHSVPWKKRFSARLDGLPGIGMRERCGPGMARPLFTCDDSVLREDPDGNGYSRTDLRQALMFKQLLRCDGATTTLWTNKGIGILDAASLELTHVATPKDFRTSSPIQAAVDGENLRVWHQAINICGCTPSPPPQRFILRYAPKPSLRPATQPYDLPPGFGREMKSCDLGDGRKLSLERDGIWIR